jgi:hypothetical protein
MGPSHQQELKFLEKALETAQAVGDSAIEPILKGLLYKLLLVDAPLECRLIAQESKASPTPTQAACEWPLEQAGATASLMEQVNAMPVGQAWLEVTAGQLTVPACPPGVGPASFKQQLGEAMQNHENEVAVQEGRRARKFNYSRWIFRA